MDIEKIEKFIDAGYTKAEIEALENKGANGEPAGNEPSKESGATTPDAGKEQSSRSTENASAINAGGDISAAIEALTNTVTGLKETVKAMQDANIKNASTEKPKKDDVKSVIDSFMSTL